MVLIIITDYTKFNLTYVISMHLSIYQVPIASLVLIHLLNVHNRMLPVQLAVNEDKNCIKGSDWLDRKDRRREMKTGGELYRELLVRECQFVKLYNLSIIFCMPFTDIIILSIILDMFSINELITKSSTGNWQDDSYSKCLETITFTIIIPILFFKLIHLSV